MTCFGDIRLLRSGIEHTKKALSFADRLLRVAHASMRNEKEPNMLSRRGDVEA
jgi:hypothetical protein